MKTLKQLLRQPLKTTLGIVLMTLAISILCVCVSQAFAAYTTKRDLDRRFTTVAIPSIRTQLEGTDQICVEQNLLNWLEEMALEHPDIVKSPSPNGILSAYIPELLPYNTRAESNPLRLPHEITPDKIYVLSNDRFVATSPYGCAMLVITLEEVSEPLTPVQAYLSRPKDPYSSDDLGDVSAFGYITDYMDYFDNMRWKTLTTGYTVNLVGTVTEVVSLQDGLRDPTGMTARLTLTMPTLEQLQALDLVPGEQYIVYGADYYDGYRHLVTFLSTHGYGHVDFTPFDPSMLEVPSQEEIDRYKANWKGDIVIEYDDVPLQQWQYDMMNSVYMTMCMPSNLMEYDEIWDANGNLLNLIPKSEFTYIDGDGQTHTLSAEEFDSRYGLPTIARLDGDLEGFLASAEGESWKTAYEQAQINSHAFTVVGIEEIDQLAAFVLGNAKMREGREFTPEDVKTGARVCIIHELTAQMAGLQIGDTINLSFYGTDYGLPYQSDRADGENLLLPAASFYAGTVPITETAEYTIVGFWRGAAWPDSDVNPYSFSCNTVFVPRTSVQSPMEESSSITFFSAVLENGMISQFHELAKEGGYAGRFKYFDQDYSKIATNFHNYIDLARQVLTVGIVLYVILLLLFLMLYPGVQKKAANTMQSLGSNYMQRFAYVLCSSMCIVVPATVLGSLLGLQLWDGIVAALLATAETTVALQLEPGVLVIVAAVQLMLALVVNVLVSLFVSRTRGMSSRR